MSRNDVKRIEFPNKELYYGLFNGQVKNVKNQEVTLKDFLSKKEINIKFNASLDYDITAGGKQVWINQIGDVGYGNEKDLFENFKFFMKNKVRIAPKRYWKARKGEKILLNFLKNIHGLNPFSEDTDYTKKKDYWEGIINDENGENFKKLLVTDDGRELNVGGILYITPEFEEKVLNIFVPSMKVSVLRNCKGDFSLLSKDAHIKDIAYIFNNDYAPPGYYNWGNITEYIHKIKKHDSSSL